MFGRDKYRDFRECYFVGVGWTPIVSYTPFPSIQTFSIPEINPTSTCQQIFSHSSELLPINSSHKILKQKSIFDTYNQISRSTEPFETIEKIFFVKINDRLSVFNRSKCETQKLLSQFFDKTLFKWAADWD